MNASDILYDEEDANNFITPGDHAVGLHPKYQYAYAPGRVINVESDGALKMEFYDGQVAVVPRVEAYFISPLKFQSDCKSWSTVSLSMFCWPLPREILSCLL